MPSVILKVACVSVKILRVKDLEEQLHIIEKKTQKCKKICSDK